MSHLILSSPIDNFNINLYIISMREKRKNSEREAICRRFMQIVEEELLIPLSDLAPLMGYATPATLYSIKAKRCLPDIARLKALSKIRSPGGMRPNLDWILTGEGGRMLSPADTAVRDLKPELIRSINRQPIEKLVAAQVLFGK